MNYKFTKREKKLLYLLLIILIVMGGWFLLITPSLDSLSSAKSDNSQASQNLASLKASYVDYSDSGKKLKTVMDEVESVKAPFYAILLEEDIDKTITQLVVNNGFTPIQLSMNGATETEIPSYLDSIKEDVDLKSGTYPSAYVASVDVNVAGSVNELLRLMEAVEKNSALKITAISSGETSGVTLLGNAKEYQITFEIYMLMK